MRTKRTILEPMIINVQALDDDALLPTKAHANDAAWDIYVLADTSLPPRMVTTVRTGLAFAIPPGWYGQLLTRSGSAQWGLFVVGGVIDSGYRGEVKVLIFNAANTMQAVRQHERIAQMVLHRVPRVEWIAVDELPDTDRGTGGFGSTGR